MSQTTLEAIHVKSSRNASKLRLQGKDAISASSTVTDLTPKTRQIWWSNAIFFIAFHIVGLSAWYCRPTSWRTWFLCYINWQLGTLGITIGRFYFILLTIGYHRLWSHRSFTARLPLRIVLAAMGTLGFQGSIRLEIHVWLLIVDGGFCDIVYTIVSRIPNLIPIPPITGSFTVM
jgi:hypothetical protein